MMTDFPNTTKRDKRIAKGKDSRKLHKEREIKGILIVWRESFRWGKDFLAGEDWGSCHVPCAR